MVLQGHIGLAKKADENFMSPKFQKNVLRKLYIENSENQRANSKCPDEAVHHEQLPHHSGSKLFASSNILMFKPAV